MESKFSSRVAKEVLHRKLMGALGCGGVVHRKPQRGAWDSIRPILDEGSACGMRQ